MKNIDKVINEVTRTIKHTDAVVEAVVILPEETRHRNAEWKDVYTCTMATVIFLINFIVCIIFCGVIQNKVDAIEHFLVSYISSVSHILFIFPNKSGNVNMFHANDPVSLDILPVNVIT